MPEALAIVRHFYPEVTSVKDAKRSIHIEVLPKDTNVATVKNHKECAMAVACKRKLKVDGVIISVSTAYLVKGKNATRFKLGQSVSREITSFDRKAGFAPGEYQLNAPAKSSRIGHGKLTPNRDHGVRGAHRKFRHITADVRTNLKNMED
jgi:hypothetical protein